MSSQTTPQYECLHRDPYDFSGMLPEHCKPDSYLPPAHSSWAYPNFLPAQSYMQYQRQPNQQLGNAHDAIPTPPPSFNCSENSTHEWSERQANHTSSTVGQSPSMSSTLCCPRQNTSTSFMPYLCDPLQSQSGPCLQDSSNSLQQTQFWPHNLYELQSYPSYPIYQPNYAFQMPPPCHSCPLCQPDYEFQMPLLQPNDSPSNYDDKVRSILPSTSKTQKALGCSPSPRTTRTVVSAECSRKAEASVSDLPAKISWPSTSISGYVPELLFSNRILDASGMFPVSLSQEFCFGNDGREDDDGASKSFGLTVPSVVTITPSEAALAPCSSSEVQSSSRIMANPAPPSQKTRDFPKLGFSATSDDGSYTNQATAENWQSPCSDLCTPMTDVGSSPARSDLSSLGWTDDGQDAETLRLISISSNALVSAYIKLATESTSKAFQTWATNSSPPYEAPSKQTQNAKSSPNDRKRKSIRFDCGSDDFDDNGNLKRQKGGSTQSPQASSDILLLACPFNKYDSILFGSDSSEEAYHACATCSFVNIAHLKQHLQRNHYMPKHHCFRCCRRFISQAMAASHMRQHPPCETLDPPLYRDRIGPDMIEDLGLDRKNLPGTNRVDYWHRLYNTFFPGAADRRPVSPYYEGPAAQHVNRFLRFSLPAIRDLLPEVQQRLGLDETWPRHNLIRLIEEILQDATRRYLQQITGLSAFQIGRDDSFTTIGSTVASQPESAISNPDANNEAPQSTSTPPLSMQESLGDSSQPSVSSTSVTSSSITESPNFPRTPLSVSIPSRPLETLTVVGGPLTQDLLVKPANNSEAPFSFEAPIAYNPSFDWSTEFDNMESYDWDKLLAEVSDEMKTAEGRKP